MAFAIYPKFKEALLKGDVDLDTATVKAILVDSAEITYDSAHDFVNDLNATGIVAESDAAANKTMTNGVFDCDPLTFTAVTGDQCEALIFFIDTGNTATDRLICWLDSANVTGLPVTPNGGDINVAVANVFTL